MDFWDIYHTFYNRVRKFIITLVKDEWVADDLVQETFLKVQQKIDAVRDHSRLSAWIFRIAYNLCQDHFRRTHKLSKRETPILEKTPVLSAPEFQKELEQHQMGECVQDQIKLLPESLRTVLVLFDVFDLSQQEIADILGISVANVKIRLHRARKKLKEILKEKCIFEHDERNVFVCDPIEAKR